MRTASTLLLVAGFALAGCAPVRFPESYPEVRSAVDLGKERGLELVNPYALDDEIRSTVDLEVGRWGTPYDRLRRVLRFMNDRGFLGFQYEPDVTVPATEAYHHRRGNCMSYTNLFMGIARHLDVEAFLIHINEATSFYEQDGTFVVSSHMAIGYDTAVRITVVDLGGESDRLRVYERASDLGGFCLFYNNVAVEKMLGGDIEGADQLLRFLVEIYPQMKETRNNLGVLLLRQARYEEALAIYTELILSAPDYRPAYTNGLLAAKAVGSAELVATFAQGAESLAEKDPFYLFNQGVEAFQGGRFADADGLFKRALFHQPHNPLLHAWLAKNYLQSGRIEEGILEFSRAQQLAPYHKVLSELRGLYPELESVAPPTPAP